MPAHDTEPVSTGRRQITRAAALGGLWLAATTAVASPATAAPAAPDDASPTLVNVREFGARGDGKADDTKAVQRAVDAAAERGGRHGRSSRSGHRPGHAQIGRAHV